MIRTLDTGVGFGACVGDALDDSRDDAMEVGLDHASGTLDRLQPAADRGTVPNLLRPGTHPYQLSESQFISLVIRVATRGFDGVASAPWTTSDFRNGGRPC